jgi:hypothetical protein
MKNLKENKLHTVYLVVGVLFYLSGMIVHILEWLH